MPGKPWNPPLNAEDRLLEGRPASHPLWASEAVSMMKRQIASEPRWREGLLRYPHAITEKELADREEILRLAKIGVAECGYLFPELDENGDCIVDGKERPS